MKSVKYASIIAVAAFVSGSFVASPELRAYAAATIGSADIIDESIQSVDIKNGQVKASDIGAGAVGGSELIGVTKLLFGQCVLTSGEGSTSVGASGVLGITCTISGVDTDDRAVATYNLGNICFEVAQAITQSGSVAVYLRNDCTSTEQLGSGGKIGAIVYDK